MLLRTALPIEILGDTGAPLTSFETKLSPSDQLSI
jgi:hypothetical protein